jgi:hypothetical protein
MAFRSQDRIGMELSSYALIYFLAIDVQPFIPPVFRTQ